jgi:hypothetical protein
VPASGRFYYRSIKTSLRKLGNTDVRVVVASTAPITHASREVVLSAFLMNIILA